MASSVENGYLNAANYAGNATFASIFKGIRNEVDKLEPFSKSFPEAKLFEGFVESFALLGHSLIDFSNKYNEDLAFFQGKIYNFYFQDTLRRML